MNSFRKYILGTFFLFSLCYPLGLGAQEDDQEFTIKTHEEESAYDFLSLQIKSPTSGRKRNNFEHYLGANFYAGYGIGDKKVKRHAKNLNIQSTISYINNFYLDGGVPAAGFQAEFGALYGMVFDDKSVSRRETLPIFSAGIKVYTGSPFYIAGGLHVAFNLKEKKPWATAGPYFALGGIIHFNNKAIMDIALKWSLFTEGSDFNKIYGEKGRPALLSQSVGLVIGFYGVI